MRRRAIACIVSAVTAVALLAGCGSSKPRPLSGVVVTPPRNVSRVVLPDAADRDHPFVMRPAANGLLVVYFGYTSCPDLCPTTLSDISVALRKIGGHRAQHVSVAMVSVDPERDTAEVMTTYLGHFFTTAHALRTDDQKRLTAAAAAFGVKYEVAKHAAGATDYEVGHTSFTYVVNDQGLVVDQWPFGIKAPEMASDLQLLLQREGS